MTPQASVSFGAAMHARHAPVRNRFSYGLFTLCLPLSKLAELRLPLFSINRFNLLAFHERDHGARDGSPLLPWIRELLTRHDLAQVADGEVMLQTLPRLFGYVFNPVSFWYCLDHDGQIRAVLAEVNNTFGGHHNYLIAHADGRAIENDDVLSARKILHVSPFFPVRGEYRFRFSQHNACLGVALDYYDGGMKMLSTRLSGRPLPLTTRNLLAAWMRCPLLTLGVIARIHWQALRLLFLRVPFLGARLQSSMDERGRRT
ncbi:MAG: cyclopropane fatty acid synthase [Rhodocyclales bacterium]|nr:cyclopropane fatty acid synthase [Rhodocyclales bacterium]